MKKNKLLITIGAAVLVGIAVSYRVVCLQSDKLRHIGMLSILSGEFSKVGQDALKGAMMYVDEYNGKHGGRKFILDVEDGRAEAKSSATGFSKLLSKNVMGCIVVGDNQALPVASMAVARKMPTVVCSTGTSAFLSENKANAVWIVKYSSAVATEADQLAVYAKKELDVSSVSLLTMEGSFGNDSGNAFRKAFIANGGSIKSHETFSVNVNDSRPQIKKILIDRPDAIYVSGYGISYFGVINQIRESGYKKLILTTDCISIPYAKGVIKDFENILYSGFVVNHTSSYLDFEKRYRDRYHESPTRDSVYGYDSAALLCEALDGAMEKSQVVDFILNKSSVHLAGEVRYLKNGDTIFPISFIWAVGGQE